MSLDFVRGMNINWLTVSMPRPKMLEVVVIVIVSSEDMYWTEVFRDWLMQ